MQADSFGTIRLGNKREKSNFKPEVGDFVVSIDRPSMLANPYRVGEHRTRQQAIDEFRALFETDMKRREGGRYEAVCKIVEHLVAGQDVILMCWCHPMPCHGTVIMETVEKLLKP